MMVGGAYGPLPGRRQNAPGGELCAFIRALKLIGGDAHYCVVDIFAVGERFAGFGEDDDLLREHDDVTVSELGARNLALHVPRSTLLPCTQPLALPRSSPHADCLGRN